SFTRNLVKGKIAETIFAQMFREAKKYTVLEFGYEKIIPELVQAGYNSNTGIVETLRSAPDFAVIDNEERHVKLIEVKYRNAVNNLEILDVAKRMHESWNPSWLFVCSLEGFYFDKVDKIIENNGHIDKLTNEIIPNTLQLRYLEILCDFEDNK
ncbi:MAG: hypothetical protein ACM3KF_02585, partial [Acidobacteriota bacterium]